MSDITKQIIFMSAAYPGHTHDFVIFKNLFADLDFSGRVVYVDSGFVGIKKNITGAIIYIPHKSSKNHPLTQDQKDDNTALSKVRVVIENSIAKIKSFFVLRIENRMKIKQRIDEVIGLCADLANFKTKMSLTINT